LDKNEKIIIEELSTTNAEFKKVNSFLVNEIEQLKKENDFLKVELIKLHMNDSLTSNESSICNDLNSTASSSSSSTQNSSTNNENSYTSSSSSSGCESARSSPSVTSVTTTNSVLKSKCSNINSDNVRKLNSYVEQFNNEYKTPNNNNNNKKHSASSSSSSASSSSWSISSNSISHSNNKTSQLIKNSLNNDNTNIIDENKSIKIDLSRYINDDDDDDDENDYDRSFVNKNDTDDEFDLSNGLPPNEFTF
jgi:hypothetical protein